MPYKIEKGHGCPDSHPWAMVKEDDGKKMGCHESQAGAKRQIAAIHISEARKAGRRIAK